MEPHRWTHTSHRHRLPAVTGYSPPPSPSFVHSYSSNHRHLHKPPARRFSTYPRHSETPAGTPFHTTSSSSPASSSHRDLKYAGFRRRTNFSRQYEISPAPEVAVSSIPHQIPQKCDVSDEKTSNRNKFTELAGGRLKFRWQMAFLVAVSSLYLFYICDCLLFELKVLLCGAGFDNEFFFIDSQEYFFCIIRPTIFR
ncbi:hypothetical protein R6Q59_024140 [Mikania micrantha]